MCTYTFSCFTTIYSAILSEIYYIMVLYPLYPRYPCDFKLKINSHRISENVLLHRVWQVLHQKNCIYLWCNHICVLSYFLCFIVNHKHHLLKVAQKPNMKVIFSKNCTVKTSCQHIRQQDVFYSHTWIVYFMKLSSKTFASRLWENVAKCDSS